MKFISVMFDNLLKKEYKLYEVNAKELSQRLYKSYKLPKLHLQLFNSDTKLAEKIEHVQYVKRVQRKIEKGDWRVKDLQEIVKAIYENKDIINSNIIETQFGYEVMPVAISVEGDFENPDVEIELLDGFKRMFCVAEVPDINILVKVYKKLDDREWINSMIIYNSWKFANGEPCERYMDRGFQLGLYYRYGMRFMDINKDLLFCDIYQIINVYTKGGEIDPYWNACGLPDRVYATLWNNNQFYKDLVTMSEIFTHKPYFKVEKRGGKIEDFEYNRNRASQIMGRGIGRLYEVFISLIGEIRRLELKKGIVDRKAFDINIFYDYIKAPELQKHFLKLTKMEVDGFICNYIKDHLKEGMRERVYTEMGYEYTPPRKGNYKEFTIENIKF